MDGKSLNITEEKLKKLKKLIPEAFTEGKIDWEKLKAALGDDIEFKNERYVLNWAGKSDAFRVLQSPTTATLVPDEKESINFNNTENVFIEGENLEVLKVLQKSYFGKIKMIYIDPPYNTGNDNFIYPDKFSETREEYLERIGDKDETGYMTREGLFRKNSKDSGHYHSNWLSMMYPRLFLARNLLRDDGVIFVSIDDNEVHNLRMMMNEVFGEENFVSALKWKKKKQPSYMSTHVAEIVEYILIFAKNKNSLEKLSIETRSDFNTRLDNAGNKISERCIKKGIRVKLPDDITIIKAGVYKIRTMEIKYLNDVKIKNGRTINDIKIKARFRNNQEQVSMFVEKDCLFITSNYGLRRDLLPEEKEMRKSIKDLLLDWGDNQDSDTEIKSIFTEGNIFNYPKPTKLIKNLIGSIFTENDIILDFFSGSATTAHAVLDLNKEDGGNRKFILVQLPEKCDEKSEAYKAGYKTIAEIGKERIRRVIKKIEKEQKGELDLDGKAGKQDLGFKVFKLQKSNFKIWRQDIKTEEELQKQLQIHIDPLDENTKMDNILYELLLKSGVPLTAKITRTNGVYLVNNGEIALILEKVDKAIIKKVIAEKPNKIITLDRLFKNNDQLKTNTALQMKDAEIGFKVV
ncbi:site-specific DNA-methyltransferase [bacterium]|nr:site-specific DNA-methyltransferase [bacterium]